MPSNKDLIADIENVAEVLGLEVPTEDLKNGELAALLSDLKAKQKDLENDTVADNATPSSGHVVAPGKSLVTLRGVIAEGDAVTASDFAGGGKQIKELKDKGYII